MSSSPLNPLAGSFGYVFVVAAVIIAVKWSQPSKVSMVSENTKCFLQCSSPQLDAIPTVGSSSWLGSWWAGLTYRTNAPDIMREGYAKASLVPHTFHTRSLTVFQHKSVPFKVAELYRWIVVLTTREHVEELRSAPDDALSFREAVHDASNPEFLSMTLNCTKCR